MDGWVGWDLCVGLLYGHRFAVLIKIKVYFSFWPNKVLRLENSWRNISGGLLQFCTTCTTCTTSKNVEDEAATTAKYGMYLAMKSPHEVNP